MKAARIHQFGGPEVIVIDDLPIPVPGPGEVVVRVSAAGVGPWDALIREGKAAVNSPLPITLGSDLSGVIAAVGQGVGGRNAGDEVYGATNQQFCGAYTEYAIAKAGMIAPKPGRLGFIEAASAPVVAVTAWQMLFDYAHAQAGQTVLIHGGAGNVGAYVVQLAREAGLQTIVTTSSKDAEYVRSLGANTVIDYQRTRFEDVVPAVDAVLDTVGGEVTSRSFPVLKPDGILVSVVSPQIKDDASKYGKRAVFFLVEVNTARLDAITKLFEAGTLTPQIASVLPLEQARQAHQRMAEKPHQRGKIVLKVTA